jgi:pyruvate dehydrogenase complex dehydrogenase (E1) component
MTSASPGKARTSEARLHFRDRFDLPLTQRRRCGDESSTARGEHREMTYLRRAKGGHAVARCQRGDEAGGDTKQSRFLRWKTYAQFCAGRAKARKLSTTMAMVRLMARSAQGGESRARASFPSSPTSSNVLGMAYLCPPDRVIYSRLGQQYRGELAVIGRSRNAQMMGANVERGSI